MLKSVQKCIFREMQNKACTRVKAETYDECIQNDVTLLYKTFQAHLSVLPFILERFLRFPDCHFAFEVAIPTSLMKNRTSPREDIEAYCHRRADWPNETHP